MLKNKKGKKMKRIILSLAVLAALSACLFALSSCGGGHEHTWSPEYTVITEAYLEPRVYRYNRGILYRKRSQGA